MAIYNYNSENLSQAYSYDGNALDYAYNKSGEIVYERDSRPLLTVMSFNVQKQLQMNTLDFQRQMITTYTPDVIGLQEYRTVSDDRYQEYPYETNSNGYVVNYEGIVSKFQMTDIENAAYQNAGPSGDNRGYNLCHIDVGGRDITFINTHLMTVGEEMRRLQTLELIDLVANSDYFIITGDFNTALTPSSTVADTDYINVYKPFIDLGCSVANNSVETGFNATYYWYDTTQQQFTQVTCPDSIIVSPNINITNVVIDQSKLSIAQQEGYLREIDHLPVIATLRIN